MKNEFNLILCSDCGCKEGEPHADGCDQEICSECGKQVLAHGKCKGAKPEPFFKTKPMSCERCDKIIWIMKMVSDEEWKFICGVTYDLKCVLCPECMEWIARTRRKK